MFGNAEGGRGVEATEESVQDTFFEALGFHLFVVVVIVVVAIDGKDTGGGCGCGRYWRR